MFKIWFQLLFLFIAAVASSGWAHAQDYQSAFGQAGTYDPSKDRPIQTGNTSGSNGSAAAEAAQRAAADRQERERRQAAREESQRQREANDLSTLNQLSKPDANPGTGNRPQTGGGGSQSSNNQRLGTTSKNGQRLGTSAPPTRQGSNKNSDQAKRQREEQLRRQNELRAQQNANNNKQWQNLGAELNRLVVGNKQGAANNRGRQGQGSGRGESSGRGQVYGQSQRGRQADPYRAASRQGNVAQPSEQQRLIVNQPIQHQQELTLSEKWDLVGGNDKPAFSDVSALAGVFDRTAGRAGFWPRRFRKATNPQRGIWR